MWCIPNGIRVNVGNENVNSVIQSYRNIMIKSYHCNNENITNMNYVMYSYCVLE